MSTFREQLDHMDPEEIAGMSRKYAAELNLEAHEGKSSEEVEKFLEYLYVTMHLGDYEQASEIFATTELAIQDLVKRGEEPQKSMDLWIEWTLLALNFYQEEAQTFVCYPLYKALMDGFDLLDESVSWKRARVRLQLNHHYQHWLEQGGNADALDAEQRSFLEDLGQGFEEEYEQAMTEREEAEDWDALYKLQRSLYRFYIAKRKPNDAISVMKQTLETLPNTEGYHAADSADLNMEIGKVFLQYKKKAVARKYFVTAKEIFETCGEEMEMFVYQAEGWIDEADKKF